MKKTLKTVLFLFTFILLNGFELKASDTANFWNYAKNFEAGQKETVEREWGRENIIYLGMMDWKTPSGKTVHLRIITSYRQITKANGFNDQSVLALVKTNNELIKIYDMVKRQNLPIEIRDNQLVYKPESDEILATLPVKFSQRFCVTGLNCFNEIYALRYN
ncbi:MAG: hypothetical protein MI810_03945 [Flavobacteriales bacterium]|nr:hypothetical protein [Flavobacteriales bacterium]